MTLHAPSAQPGARGSGSPTSRRHSFPAVWPGAVGMLLLLVALLPTLPGEYYDYVLPVAVLGLSAAMVVLAVRCRRWGWVVPFVVLAGVFNPIRRPTMALTAWRLADVAGAVLFLVAAYFIYPKVRPPAEGAGSPEGKT